MTAATQDRIAIYRPGQAQESPVAAAAKIYAGTFVCRKTDGYRVPGASTAGYKLDGVAESGIDNSLGLDAAENVLVRKIGVYEFIAAGLTVADEGKPVFLSDDQTITLTPTNVFAGILERVKSATEAEVLIDPAVQDGNGPRGRLFTIQAFFPGAVGAVGVKALDAFEAPGPFRVLRGFANVKTAPGAGYNCGVTITDGTTPKSFNVVAAATAGEDKAINQVYAGDADIDIDLLDDNASGATADVMVTYICEEL